MAYTELTLGFDTAVNNVLWAINTLRDTMQSHNKVTVVEVMGRRCGDIALHAGMTGGAEYILIPEVPYDMDEICKGILQSEKGDLIVIDNLERKVYNDVIDKPNEEKKMVWEFPIEFQEAKSYRTEVNSLLRPTQWQDLLVRVYV